MLIPMACLWISRNVFGLDDPLSDNISANVVGLLLANAARFFLFRWLVFRQHPDRSRAVSPQIRSRTDRARPSARGAGGG